MNKWNKDNPSRNFDSEVLEDIPAGKMQETLLW